MPVAHRRPEPLWFRVFRGSAAIRHGLLTPTQLRGTSWVRLRRDVYADSRLELDHELMCRAAILGLPSRVTIAGPSAAYLHGVEHAADATDDVHLIVPPTSGLSPRRGVVVHTTVIATSDRVAPAKHSAVRARLPHTSAARTAWDTAGWLEPIDAVPVIDTLLRLGVVTPTELGAFLRPRLGIRGSRRARRAFALADAAAQSVPESRLRVRLVMAGLPRPVAQLAVVLPNGLVLHPDLAWDEYRVAVEYDGRWHAGVDQLHRDRRRLNLLVTAGWLVLHVTSERMRGDFPSLLNEVRAALVSRGWRPGGRR